MKLLICCLPIRKTPFVYFVTLLDIFLFGTAAFVLFGFIDWSVYLWVPIALFAFFYFYLLTAVLVSFLEIQNRYTLIVVYTHARQFIGHSISLGLIALIFGIATYDQFSNPFWGLSIFLLVFQNTINTFWNNKFLKKGKSLDSQYRKHVAAKNFMQNPLIV